MVLASTSRRPRWSHASCPAISRPQARLRRRSGSVSGVFSKSRVPSARPASLRANGSTASTTLRSWTRCGAGTSSVRVVQRGEEAVLFALEQRLVLVQFEDGGHEVFLACALFEAADQVGDGNVELARVHHRGVEQQRADIPADGLGLAGGHAQEHLEFDAAVTPRDLRQQPGQGNVKEVVSGDADAHVLDVPRAQCVVQDRLVGGVRVLLAVPGRQWPAVDVGVHAAPSAGLHP